MYRLSREGRVLIYAPDIQSKQAMAKLLTSKRKRETDHIEDNEQCLPRPLPAKRLAIETPGGKKVVASSAPTDPSINIPAIITPVSKTSRIRLNKKVRTSTDFVIATITIIATTLETTPSPPPPLPLPTTPPLTEQEYPGDGMKPLFWTPEEDAQLRQLAAGGQRKVHFPTDVASYPKGAGPGGQRKMREFLGKCCLVVVYNRLTWMKLLAESNKDKDESQQRTILRFRRD
jgi:hypothetical protein